VELKGTSKGSMVYNSGYTAGEISNVPQESAEISLGCGNPTAMARLQPGEVVLDIGSGGGLDAFLAVQKVGSTGKVIGIDMTPAMLQRARKAAKKGGYENVTFRHGYADKIPLEDGSVDVIISNCVINLTEDKGKVFREAYRVLKAGGRLEVSDTVFSSAVPNSMRSSMEDWSECVAGALPEQEYSDLVSQAGFKGIAIRRSASSGQADGVEIYSVQLSARK
jgi:ubiquinone/menaquinone biosynthesis C-methylase UbiE